MNIEEITLTVDEHKEAVRMYLKSRGIDIQVKAVDSKGYPVRGWRVDAEPMEQVNPVPRPPIQTVGDIVETILAPTPSPV